MTTEINSTDIAGLLAFVPAAVACGLAFGRSRARANRGTRTWGIVGAIYALLAVEVLAKTRYLAQDKVRQLLRSANEYSERRPPQAGALLAIGVLWIILSFLIVRRVPTPAARVASVATITVVALFSVECISLHSVDALMYASAGPIVAIGWPWIICGWTTAIAASTAAR